jgi:hypothetical protein
MADPFGKQNPRAATTVLRNYDGIYRTLSSYIGTTLFRWGPVIAPALLLAVALALMWFSSTTP